MNAQITSEMSTTIGEALELLEQASLLHEPDQGCIVSANSACEQTLGHAPKALIGQSIAALVANVPPFTSHEAREMEHRAMTQGPQRFVWLLRHASGAMQPFKVDLRVVRLGSWQGLCATFYPRHACTTDGQPAVEDEPCRSLYNNAIVGLYRSSIKEGRILACNDHLAHMYGYPDRHTFMAEFLTSQNYVNPGARENLLAQLRAKGEVSDFEAGFYRRDGGVMWARFSAKIYPEHGYLEGVLADITGQREAQERQQQLEERIRHTQKLESLGILAGGIAHDFNNLLMGMLGNAGLALSELPSGSPAHAALEGIETAAMRAAELCRQLLAYSGRGRFQVQPLDLSEVVEEMANLVTVSTSKTARLEYDFSRRLPTVEADAGQLRQVVMNLITNASDAIGTNQGVIGIRTGVDTFSKQQLAGNYLHDDLPAGAYVFVEVSDTGCGMDKQTLSRIFEPFFTTKFTGRGLGMAAVLGIVRGHQGAILVESQPGKGSTFRVLLPASERPSTPKQAVRNDPADWKGSGTVLVVDDEETVRGIATRALTRIGFDVLTAVDGQEGLDLFTSHADAISVVLLDLTMPRMGGMEVLQAVKALKPGVPVILSSGYDERTTPASSSEGDAKADGFLPKPYRPSELVAKLHETLTRTQE